MIQIVGDEVLFRGEVVARLTKTWPSLDQEFKDFLARKDEPQKEED